MINILPDSPNIGCKNDVMATIERSYKEARELLVDLPDTLDIWLINEHPIETTGVSGFAYSPSIITIDFDPDFADKQLQKEALRATLFHEAYHLAQGHTHEDSRALYASALDSAVYEGAATVFEREYVGATEPYGDYSQVDPSLLQQWRTQLSAVSPEDFLANDGELWRQWAFYDPTDKQRWKLYKTGVWLIDKHLTDSKDTVLDIVKIPATKILQRISQ